MHIEGDWSELQTRGFVVVRGFLGPDAVADVLDPYLDAQGEKRGFVPAFALGEVGARVIENLEGRVRAVLPAIGERTELRLNAFDPFVAYFPNHPNRWHTDEPPYWMFQNLAQYVNVWIPLLKPSPSRSGLSLVPLDSLRAREPAMFEALYACGGAAFAPPSAIAKGNVALAEYLYGPDSPHPSHPADHLLIERAEGLLELEPKVDINDLAVTPDLVAGDAIFCRGDVLHTTQPGGEPDRVAISIRVVNGDMQVSRDFFLKRSEFTRRLMANPEGPFVAPLLAAFAYHEKETLSVSQVIDFLKANRKGSPAQAETVKRTRPKLMELLGVTSYGPQV